MPKIVCVTGGTGFIASHLIKQLLKLKYIVHATVRNVQNKDAYAHLTCMEGATTNLKIFQADLLIVSIYMC